MGTRTLTIAANNDDMYFYEAGGGSACYNDASVVIGGILGDACHASFRFLGFPVDSGSAILTSARLYLHCAISGSPTQTVQIYCDRGLNPTLGVGSCDPRDRTLTTAYAEWTLPTVNVGDHVYSADLTAPLQEAMDVAGFTAGSAALIALLGHTGGGDGNGIMVASYEGAGDPAQLVLAWNDRCSGYMI